MVTEPGDGGGADHSLGPKVVRTTRCNWLGEIDSPLKWVSHYDENAALFYSNCGPSFCVLVNTEKKMSRESSLHLV